MNGAKTFIGAVMEVASMVRIRVAALVLRADRVLLARHLKDGRTSYLLPGGGMNDDETSHEALERELREEASVTARVGSLRYVIEAHAPDGSRRLIQLVFAARIEGEVGRSTDPRVVACEWHDIPALVTLALHPAVGPEIARDIASGNEEARYLLAPWVV